METQKSSNCRRAGLDLGFSDEEKEKLRELAFHAIRSRCLGIEMPEIAVDSPRLKEPGAAFVCIHRGRGTARVHRHDRSPRASLGDRQENGS